MEIISDLDKQGFRVDECHNMTNRKTGAPMPLFMVSMVRTEFHKSIFRSVTVIGYVKVIVEILRKKWPTPVLQMPGVLSLHCPKNPKPRIDAEKEKKRQQRAALTNPEPPKVNFWEQRTQTATQRQQPNSTSQPGPSTAPPPPSNPVNDQNSPSDLFEQLKNPAVQDTFDLLEQFITIATTIPSKNRSHLPWWRDRNHDQKNHSAHHEIKINNPSFETSAIKIERPNNKTITVISAYRPPRKPLLPQDLHQLFRNQDYVLVAGDLNAKHAFWSPYAQQNVAGHTIRRFCDSTGFSLSAPLEPTHFHKSLRNTVIDLAISKGMTITEVSSIPELSSDHNPVLFEVSLDNFTSPALSTYAFPNWSKFQTILTSTLPGNPKISNTDDIDNSIQNFNTTFKNAFNNSSTFKSINKPLSCIPSVIRDKIKIKNRLRKDWQDTKYPPYKTQLNKLQK
ncbi:RNA-directed DNA polymerase from mobile element jockey [Trichonephila clavata]|uniref:RNA-directed DNA polymerase from mobile element jockey n=1 Tax=Trichonephila clavata TaxID=2740835 RepID=A0A8X6F4Z7_TRICU|nr:RNA-directed DNA polymerase from mobile element jockey [Trichonephila clavata]